MMGATPVKWLGDGRAVMFPRLPAAPILALGTRVKK
jgi:hypothetical protein